MKGYKAKIKNRIPCAGVIGGVTEIPPDTRKGRKKNKRDKRVEQLTPPAQESGMDARQKELEDSEKTFRKVFFVCVFLFVLILLKSNY